MADTMGRLRAPCVTPVAALIMVQLMTLGDDRAQTTIIGRTVATITGRAWPFFAPILGIFRRVDYLVELDLYLAVRVPDFVLRSWQARSAWSV